MGEWICELHQMEREQVLGLVRGQGLDMEVIASQSEIRQTVSEYVGNATGDWTSRIVFIDI